jgi:GNAT superfamily N-acetyltransferase
MIDVLQLRLARPEDAAAILAVVHPAFAQYDGKLVPQSGAARETVETVTARLARENCVMACREERLAGCLFYQNLGDHLYLGRLAVLPEERGRGVARRLVGEVEAVALAAAIATVAAQCPDRATWQRGPLCRAWLSRGQPARPCWLRQSDFHPDGKAAWPLRPRDYSQNTSKGHQLSG